MHAVPLVTRPQVLDRNPNDPDTLHLMGLLYSDVVRH